MDVSTEPVAQISDDGNAGENLPEALRADFIPSGPILVIDIGAVYTRTIFINVAEGTYRMFAYGEAPTTSGPPWNNLVQGVRIALEQMTETTGRIFITSMLDLIRPETEAGNGVNLVVGLSSSGEPIRTVLVGLMPEISIESGRKAAESSYLELVDVISLTDKRTTEEQIAAILEAEPNVVLIVGGTDGGAVDAMREQIEKVALACSIMERNARPTVLYIGNADLQKEVSEVLYEEVGVRVEVASNVRPSLNNETLDDAQATLAALYNQQRSYNTGGFEELVEWSRGRIYPTALAFSEMIRLLGGLDDEIILGVDIGSSATSVSASFEHGHYQSVSATLGVGHAMQTTLERLKLDRIMSWLVDAELDEDAVLDLLWNRWLNPVTAPASRDSLEVQYGLAREIMRRAVLEARHDWRSVAQRGLLPTFDRLLLAGATLARPAHYGWPVLIAADALFLSGVTHIQLDPYGLAASLGALAGAHPHAVIQVLDTGSFIDVGTLVAPVGRAPIDDSMVMNGTITFEDTNRSEGFEIQAGMIQIVPLAYNKTAYIQMETRALSMPEQKKVTKSGFRVLGGEVGIVFDGRGRPWRAPRDEDERRDLFGEWRDAIVRSL